MLWIEGVGGGPLRRVPVQCRQIGQDDGPLENAAKKQARFDPRSTLMQRGSSASAPTPGPDHTLSSLTLPNQPIPEPESPGPGLHRDSLQ